MSRVSSVSRLSEEEQSHIYLSGIRGGAEYHLSLRYSQGFLTGHQYSLVSEEEQSHISVLRYSQGFLTGHILYTVPYSLVSEEEQSGIFSANGFYNAIHAGDSQILRQVLGSSILLTVSLSYCLRGGSMLTHQGASRIWFPTDLLSYTL